MLRLLLYFVLVINGNRINGFHLFWDTLYIRFSKRQWSLFVCGEESSTNQSEFGSSQLYKSFRLIANYFLSQNKIKLYTALFQHRYSGYLVQLVL